MRWIIDSSLRFRLLVLVVAAGVMAFGVSQLRDAPVDVLPEFTPPYVEIQTEALGLSADEVEQLVTVPLEADLLNGVENVDVIRSESVPGLSSITMVFSAETDPAKGRALVQERLTQAHALPNVSKPPFMLQPLSSSSRVLMIGLSSKSLTPIQRGILARWTIRPRLLGVPGVANVAIWGQREQELQVQVDPERLADKGVTLNQVIQTTGNAQLVSPLSFLEASTPGTGGFIETPTQRLGVRHVFDNLSTPEALGKVPVDGEGGRLRLTDVATLVEDHQPLIGDAIVNSGEGMMLVIEKFPGANTLEVTRGVERALEQLRPATAGLQVDDNVFRPATFIEDATGNITRTIIIGVLLMALGLAAFLFAWRTLLVSLVTIPLSLVTAAFVLDLFGSSMNAIAFAGLALGTALVIGDAVYGADNVAQRLRERRSQGSATSVPALVRAATQEMRSPLMFASLIALLSAVPIIVLEGRPGAFFEPLAVSYVVAIAASMLVALTVTPALSLVLHARATGAGAESPVVAWLRGRYDALLTRLVAAPKAVWAGAGGLVLVGLVALLTLGTSVVPTFKDRDLLVRIDAAPGTSEPAMSEITTKASRDMRALPGVETVGGHVGRAVTGDRTVGVNSSELWVSIDSDADYDKTVASVKNVVNRLEGVEQDVVTYSQQQIRDVGSLRDGEENNAKDGTVDVLTGTEKPLVVRLYGENQDTLREKAKDVQAAVAGVDGVVDPKIEANPVEPVVEVETRLADAARYGIKPGDVRRAEASLLQGITVGSIFGAQKVFDVTVQGVASTRENVGSIRNLLLDTEDGGHVRLGKVADVRVVNAPSVIRRDAVARRIDIEADISGRSLDAITADVEDRLAALDLPLEYHAEVVAESAGQEAATQAAVGFAIAAVLATLLLFQAAFRSWRAAGLAFAAVPLALVGGLLAAVLDGGTLSLGSLLGLLAVLVVATQGVLVLIARFQELERRHATSSAALVRLAASDRLAPILGAAAATGLIMLPFALLGSRAGLEIVHPMAVVILGGLVTATVVTLLVVPVAYLRFAGGSEHPDSDDLDSRTVATGPDGEPRSAVFVGSGWDGPAAPEPAPRRRTRFETSSTDAGGAPPGDPPGLAMPEPAADGAPPQD
jgi:Cu/Ag efflux pump CusA